MPTHFSSSEVPVPAALRPVPTSTPHHEKRQKQQQQQQQQQQQLVYSNTLPSLRQNQQQQQSSVVQHHHQQNQQEGKLHQTQRQRLIKKLEEQQHQHQQQQKSNHQQQKHFPSHSELTLLGETITHGDGTNLVGSATGQVAAILCSVVTPVAGAICEGEILESRKNGAEYIIKCPVPEVLLETKSEKAARRFRLGESRCAHHESEKNIDPELAPLLESVARSVTPDGLDEAEVTRQTQVEKATTKRFFTATFRRRDVLPFGFQQPSAVFGKLGRHTNLGLVIGWDNTFFTYQLEQRTFVGDVRDLHAAKGFSTFQGKREALYSTRVVSATLGELQLLPALTRGKPCSSFRVGSVVECRRFGSHDLDEGVVVSVSRDVTYKVKFKSDLVVQDGILHSDVRLVNASRAERYGVRDRVLVGLMGAKRSTVIQCYQDGRFYAVTDEGEQLLLGDTSVLSVRQCITDAIGARKELTDLFDKLDENLSGKIKWLKFRKEILDSSTTLVNTSSSSSSHSNGNVLNPILGPLDITPRQQLFLRDHADELNEMHHYKNYLLQQHQRVSMFSGFSELSEDRDQHQRGVEHEGSEELGFVDLNASANDGGGSSSRASVSPPMSNFSFSQNPHHRNSHHHAHYVQNFLHQQHHHPHSQHHHHVGGGSHQQRLARQSIISMTGLVSLPPSAVSISESRARLMSIAESEQSGGNERSPSDSPRTSHFSPASSLSGTLGVTSTSGGSGGGVTFPTTEEKNSNSSNNNNNNQQQEENSRSNDGLVTIVGPTLGRRGTVTWDQFAVSDNPPNPNPPSSSSSSSQQNQQNQNQNQQQLIPHAPNSPSPAASLSISQRGSFGGGQHHLQQQQQQQQQHNPSHRGSIISMKSRRNSLGFNNNNLGGGGGSVHQSHRGSISLPPHLQQQNIVSFVATGQQRNEESARIEKEIERQECVHDEVGQALDAAFDEWNALKGLPPTAYHAGHDTDLAFRDFAFLYEKIERKLKS